MPRTGSPAYRLLNLLGLTLSGGGLLYAIVFLEPLLAGTSCLFCALVRALLLCLSLIYLLALVHNPASGGQRFYGFIGFVLISAGLFTLGYHGWIQTTQPALTDAQLLTCQMSLEQLSLQGSLFERLQSWFQLATHCPIPRPDELTLSINLQTLIGFTLLMLLNLRLMLLQPRREGYFV